MHTYLNNLRKYLVNQDGNALLDEDGNEYISTISRQIVCGIAGSLPIVMFCTLGYANTTSFGPAWLVTLVIYAIASILAFGFLVSNDSFIAVLIVSALNLLSTWSICHFAEVGNSFTQTAIIGAASYNLLLLFALKFYTTLRYIVKNKLLVKIPKSIRTSALIILIAIYLPIGFELGLGIPLRLEFQAILSEVSRFFGNESEIKTRATVLAIFWACDSNYSNIGGCILLEFLNRVSEEFKQSTEAKIIQEQEQIAEIYHSKSMLDDEMIYEGVGWQPDKRFTRFLYKKNSCSWDIDDLDQFTDPYLSIILNTTSQRILEEEIRARRSFDFVYDFILHDIYRH